MRPHDWKNPKMPTRGVSFFNQHADEMLRHYKQATAGAWEKERNML